MKAATRDLSTATLCEALGLDRRTIRKYVEAGCPCTRGRNLKFNADEVKAWMKSKGFTGKVGRPAEVTSEDMELVKLRKERAAAEKIELQNAITKRLWHSVDECEQQRVAKIQTVRNRLLGLGASLAPILHGQSTAEIQTAIDNAVTEILTEFSRG